MGRTIVWNDDRRSVLRRLWDDEALPVRDIAHRIFGNAAKATAVIGEARRLKLTVRATGRKHVKGLLAHDVLSKFRVQKVEQPHVIGCRHVNFHTGVRCGASTKNGNAFCDEHPDQSSIGVRSSLTIHDG